MTEYRIININEYSTLAELRWTFQHEESLSLDLSQKDVFINDCLQMLLSLHMQEIYTHFGIFIDNKLCGCASLCVINKIPRPSNIIDPIGYLTNVFVLPEYRNNRLGYKLIEHIKDFAKDKNLEIIVVWPSESSDTFYARLGFAPRGQPLVYKLREY
jgi:GNAT superfamily N-acetyltransferase